VEWFECGVEVIGDECGDEVEEAFSDFVDSIKTQMGCDDGLF